MSKVYVLTGMPGSGKEEFAKVAQECGYHVVRMGEVVREEAARRGIAMDDRGVGGFATSEREAHGPGIWAERCISRLGSGKVIIDGSRSIMEMGVFRAKLGDRLKLVAIHASPSVRYERLRKRGRFDAPRNIDEFRVRDERELGWGLGTLLALADVMIVNDQSLEEFQDQVRKELGC